MRLNLVRKAAVALAVVAGAAGLSMAAPVAAHAEEPAVQTVQDPTLYENVTLEGVEGTTLYEARPRIVGRTSIDLGGGCTQHFIFFSDGSHITYVRCVVIIRDV